MLTRMPELKRVLVVGAGTMGSQIALQTALSGRYEVTLVDSAPGQLERARSQNRRLLDRSVEKARLSEAAAEAALARIKDSDDLATVAGSADLVIEAVIEDFDAKKSVFESLGKHAKKDAILASNSSTIAISMLGGFTGRAEQCSNRAQRGQGRTRASPATRAPSRSAGWPASRAGPSSAATCTSSTRSR